MTAEVSMSTQVDLKHRAELVMRELERMSRTYGVPVDDMTAWLRRTYGIGTYGRVTDEHLRALEAEVRRWVGEIDDEREETTPVIETETRAVVVHAETAPVAREPDEERRRLLRNLILRDATDAQIDLVLRICERYGFDPLLKHVVLISGQLYVTRDGLLHIAHASGQLDGIEVEAERDADGKWIATAKVYRKDMARPFVYSAHQAEHEVPQSKAWQKAPRAMTVKCAEVMALRRAFAVAIGGAEEIGYEGEVE